MLKRKTLAPKIKEGAQLVGTPTYQNLGSNVSCLPQSDVCILLIESQTGET